MREYLNDENFMLYSAAWYNNKQCYNIEEYHEDLKRIVYIKRLLGKYHDTGVLKHRLILNHIIIFSNVFGARAVDMLFFKLPEFKEYVKTFLVYMNLMPDRLEYIGPELIYSSDIGMDTTIIAALRKINEDA